MNFLIGVDYLFCLVKLIVYSGKEREELSSVVQLKLSLFVLSF